jgi:hypothetical protein
MRPWAPAPTPLLGAPDRRLDAADIASRWGLASVYWHEV